MQEERSLKNETEPISGVKRPGSPLEKKRDISVQSSSHSNEQSHSGQSQGQQRPPPLPGHDLRLTSSIFGKRIYSDAAVQVGLFLQSSIHKAHQFIHDLKQSNKFVKDCHVEVFILVDIEAKFGVFVDPRSKDRFYLPIRSEAVLDDLSLDFRFESNMSENQHRTFNQMLNQATQNKLPIRYSHSKQMDFLYKGERGFRSIRKSVDQKTREVLAVLSKTLIANLHISNPNSPFDYRISVNVEANYATMTRLKDRMSYLTHYFQVDLTKVIQSYDAQQISLWLSNQTLPSGSSTSHLPSVQTTHELEMEFCHMPSLLKELEKMERKERHGYFELMEGCMHNLRQLSQMAPPL